jgi:NAD(P)-dependent dehydrogenase (short-subunit alcohol dehydrogenase family)
MFTSDGLNGQVILVTGASSGIGRAGARLFAAAGARLILLGRDPARLEESAGMLAGTGHIILPSVLDDADGAADLIKSAAADHGELNGIFHCAGTELIRPTRMTKQAQLDALFGPAVNAAMGIARAANSKGVVADGGSLVFMSSVAGRRGTAGMVAYSAAKAAVEGMVRSLACELAPRRIRVNAIAAGAVVTEMHARLSNSLSEEGQADYERRHLLGFGTPEDVANAALFLLGPASAWITGTAMLVDGGYAVR